MEFWQELLHTVLMQFLSIQVRNEYQLEFRKPFFAFLAFKTEYFASIMGLTSVFVGLISLVNDALFAYIISEDGLNSNFHPVDVSTLNF